MITQTQSYRFPGSASASEVYYTLSSGSSCVAVNPSSGTVSPGTTVEFTFTFASESCFSSVFTLQVWDDVCATPVSNQFSIASPCATLGGTLSNTPSVSSPFVFTAIPSGGTAPYTITWEYNDGLFNLVSDNIGGRADRKIILQPRFIASGSGVLLPGSTTIKARVVDSNGCEETLSLLYTFCQPLVSSFNTISHCIDALAIGSITARNYGIFTITPTICAGSSVDWDTLELDYDTSKLHVQLGAVNGDSAVLEIYGIRPTSIQQHNFNYSVADSYGIRSNLATGTMVLQPCPLVGTGTVSGPTIPVSNTILLPGEGSGVTKELALEEIIYST